MHLKILNKMTHGGQLAIMGRESSLTEKCIMMGENGHLKFIDENPEKLYVYSVIQRIEK